MLRRKEINVFFLGLMVIFLILGQFPRTSEAAAGCAEGVEKVYADQRLVLNGSQTPYKTDIYCRDGEIEISWLPLAELLGRSKMHPVFHKEKQKISLEKLEDLLGVTMVWLPFESEVQIEGLRIKRLQRMDIKEADDYLTAEMKFNYPVKYKLITQDSPPKIILDFEGLFLDLHQMDVEDSLSGPAVKSYRLQQLVGKARLVIELKYRGPEVHVEEVDEYTLRLVLEQNFEYKFATTISRGLYYHQIRRGTAEGPLMINKLRFVPSLSNLELRPVLAENRIGERVSLSHMAARKRAAAGINAGFFTSSGMMLGLLVIDGEWVSEPLYNRTAVGITSDQRLLFDRVDFSGRVEVSVLKKAGFPDVIELSGINRGRGENELIMYNHYFGTQTKTNQYGTELVVVGGKVVEKRKGSGWIPDQGYVLSGHGEKALVLDRIAKGSEVTLNLKLPQHWEEKEVVHALGAGPRLLRAGEISISGETEHFQPSLIYERHPRTALGVDEYGDLLMVSVGGRGPGLSVGVTLFEMAKLMQEFGAVEAFNLDGGGSTTFLLRDRLINIPSQGQQRPIVSALLLVPED